jgi:hypothetical protein
MIQRLEMEIDPTPQRAAEPFSTVDPAGNETVLHVFPDSLNFTSFGPIVNHLLSPCPKFSICATFRLSDTVKGA